MDVNDHLRHTLTRLREQRGMNPNDLARQAGLNLRAVRDIEEGRSQSPKVSTVVSLAKALGVSVSLLIGEEPVEGLRKELVEFLRHYSQEDQERLLAALQAMQAPKALPKPE
jgi:transcriptional regulator with XRE-family HTH domain